MILNVMLLRYRGVMKKKKTGAKSELYSTVTVTLSHVKITAAQPPRIISAVRNFGEISGLSNLPNSATTIRYIQSCQRGAGKDSGWALGIPV